MPEIRPPSPLEDAFECPYCRTFAKQHWKLAYGGSGSRWKTPEEAKAESDLILSKTKTGKANTRPPMRVIPATVERTYAEMMAEVEDQEKRAKYPGGARLSLRSWSVAASHVNGMRFSQCEACGRLAVWLDQRLIYPENATTVEPPNQMMPAHIAEDYREAAAILDQSPRGAAALARLGLQKLCIFLGEPGKDINTDIRSLVSKGLDARMVRLMDSVRITGNLALHPGEIDLKDDRQSATMVLGMLNRIVASLIAEPAAEEAFYNSLPQDKRKWAEQADAKARAQFESERKEADS